MTDGEFVHIPKIAVSTGQIDAMECVFSKMGLANGEFGDPGADGSAAPRVHLYRGGDAEEPAGASIGPATPHNAELYSSLERLQKYDMVIADCEGPSADQPGNNSEAAASGPNVREYVNRGGRMFASHLSFSWLLDNGDQPYAEATPIETGLADAAEWDEQPPEPNHWNGCRFHRQSQRQPAHRQLCRLVAQRAGHHRAPNELRHRRATQSGDFLG